MSGSAWHNKVEGGDDCGASVSGSKSARGGEELFKLMDNVGMRTSEHKHAINRFRLGIRFLIILHNLQ